VVALAGFAGVANASATLDLIWIDVTDSTCTDADRRDCPEIGSDIYTVYSSDDITLKVMVTAGPGGYIGGQMSVDYSDTLPKLSVIGFRRLLTKFPEYYLPGDFSNNGLNDTGTRIETMQTTAVPLAGNGIGLPAFQTAYVGTVAFHKDALVNGTFEISVDTLGTGDGLGNLGYVDISDTSSYNSAFLVNVPEPGALSLLVMGLGGMLLAGRGRRS
jgi:hypothetical protein